MHASRSRSRQNFTDSDYVGEVLTTANYDYGQICQLRPTPTPTPTPQPWKHGNAQPLVCMYIVHTMQGPAVVMVHTKVRAILSSRAHSISNREIILEAFKQQHRQGRRHRFWIAEVGDGRVCWGQHKLWVWTSFSLRLVILVNFHLKETSHLQHGVFNWDSHLVARVEKPCTVLSFRLKIPRFETIKYCIMKWCLVGA